MYAIIETGGKQYKVEAGDTVFIEKLNVEADAEITFDKVVAVGAEDGMKVGAPLCGGRDGHCQGHQEWQGQKDYCVHL